MCEYTKERCRHLLFFAVLVDVVTELARECVLSEVLCADD